MKKKFLNISFYLILLCLCASSVFSQSGQPFSRDESPLPKPSNPVVDIAGVLDAETKARLDKTLIEFAETSNPRTELAVAIVKTTDGIPIFDYSLAVARGWGIGSRADDNPGLLLFVAIDDRKYFTQVSKDLEDELPDGIVGSLQRTYLVPPFKRGDYSKGIEDTINAFISTIEARRSGMPAPTPQTSNETSNSDKENLMGRFCQIIGCLFVIVIFILIVANSSRKDGPDKKDRDRWGGGSSGGGSSGGDIALAILGALLGNSGSSSSSSSSWGGSSSSWGGGSSGGWGGFGGGGDFGGGGSGGGW